MYTHIINMESLYQIQYTSACVEGLTEAQLLRLVIRFRIANNEIGITGILVYNEGVFFQIIEGEKDDVIALYSRILTDTRHTNIVKLIEAPLAERTFKKWSLAYVNREDPHH